MSVVQNKSVVSSRLGVSAGVNEVVVPDLALEDVAADHDDTWKKEKVLIDENFFVILLDVVNTLM